MPENTDLPCALAPPEEASAVVFVVERDEPHAFAHGETGLKSIQAGQPVGSGGTAARQGDARDAHERADIIDELCLVLVDPNFRVLHRIDLPFSTLFHRWTYQGDGLGTLPLQMILPAQPWCVRLTLLLKL